MRIRRKSHADASDGNGHRRFEKAMFSFMGPAQIGENRAPEGYVPDDAANMCHKCGQPWAAHERVHTGTMTYRRCPA